MLLCPVCHEPLTQAEQALRCGRGHSYDLAKEGYVNLLLANQKASAAPGDTKGMVVSRRRFLERGYYAPLSDRINALAGSSAAAVLDAGCGEGYYLNRLRQSLPTNAEVYGLDISREAIKLGAALYKAICFAVGSVHQRLPFADASLDLVLNVFAPRNPAEFTRILRPSGKVIVVVPAEGHLAALQDALGLARIDDSKENRTAADFDGMLSISRSETIRYRRVLHPEDRMHLIQMMPAVWHVSEEARASLQTLPSREIEFAFTLIELQGVLEGPPRNEQSLCG